MLLSNALRGGKRLILIGVAIIILFAAVFLLTSFGAGGYLVSRVFRQMKQQNAADDASPVQAAEARLVAKRTNVSGSSSPNMLGSTSTFYHCTFEFANGARQEFRVAGTDFGLLAEGDTGLLTFQGSRYKGFQRQNAAARAAAS